MIKAAAERVDAGTYVFYNKLITIHHHHPVHSHIYLKLPFTRWNLSAYVYMPLLSATMKSPQVQFLPAEYAEALCPCVFA